MKFEDVKNFIDSHPEFRTRADQYRAMSLYFSIEDETIKEMMSFNRYLRSIWPADEVGKKKAQEFKMPNYLRPLEENTLFKMLRIR